MVNENQVFGGAGSRGAGFGGTGGVLRPGIAGTSVVGFAAGVGAVLLETSGVVLVVAPSLTLSGVIRRGDMPLDDDSPTFHWRGVISVKSKEG